MATGGGRNAHTNASKGRNSAPTAIRLFPDYDEPCPRCKGTGKGFNHDLGFERDCYACGGTGLEADRPNPDTTRIPF